MNKANKIKMTLALTGILAMLMLPFVAADITIANWYPKANDYVFYCNIDNANVFDWYFGDGQKLLGISNNNVFHHFENAGSYQVSCTGKNLISSETASITINPELETLDNDSMQGSITIAQYFPKQNQDGTVSYVFYCNTPGFEANTYDWYFGDSQKLLGISNNNVFHTFVDNGSYTVGCVAKNLQSIETNSLTVNVGTFNQTPQNQTNKTNISASVQITPLANLTYSFNCVVNGFVPNNYNWLIENETTAIVFSNNPTSALTYQFQTPGNYMATCEAQNGSNQVNATAFFGVQGISTNQTNETYNPLSASIIMEESQNLTVKLKCMAAGGSGNFDYDFSFGDNQTEIAVNNSVIHTYESNGTYNAECLVYDLETGLDALGNITFTLNMPFQNITNAENYNVSIEDSEFSPENITIYQGDSVTWTNNGDLNHTVTSSDSAELNETLAPGQTFMQVFTAIGEFPYHCILHPTMKGEIIVLGSN